MTRKQMFTLLENLDACDPGLAWARETKGTPEELWGSCPDGSYLLWAAYKARVDRKLQVSAACEIARTVLHLVRAGEERPRKAIEVAEAWTRGEATLDEVRAAADAAYAADAAADAADAAAAAAYASARAAYNAYAAYADAAYAADAADAAAAAYAAADARAASLANSADIARKYIPWSVVEAGLAKATNS